MKYFNKVKETISIYFLYASYDIKSQLAYTVDFWSQMIVWFVYTIIPFIGISLLFKRFNTIGNWNIYHIGVLYGIVGLAYDSSRMIGRAFDNFHKLILTGDLDVFYIRPHSIIIQIFGSQFFLRRIAGLTQYLLVLVFSLMNIKKELVVSLNIIILFVLLSFIGTLLLFIALLLIYASICFVTIEKNIFSDVFIDSTSKIGFYPIEYINKVIRYIFMFFIPIGFTAYIPMKHILFLNSTNELNHFYGLMPLFVGIICFCISRKIFLYSLKHYNSVNN